MAIINPNLEQTKQISQESIRLNSSRVKFETSTYNAAEPIKPKGSIFGKILGAFGSLVSPLAYIAPVLGPAAPFAAIGGLAGMGVGAIGNSMNARKTANQVAAAQQQRPAPISYPGTTSAPMQNDPVMNVVLNTREDALYSSSQRM